MGALQLLNLFLLQAQLTFSPSALFVDMGNNAISGQFYIAIPNTKTHICCSLARWPIHELLINLRDSNVENKHPLLSLLSSYW